MALLAPESLGDANRAGKDGRRGTGELSRGALGVAMNLPTIGLLLLVLAYPVVYAGYLSLHQVGIAQLRRGVFPWNNGDNYARLLEDPLFALALKNTILFTLLVVGGRGRSRDRHRAAPQPGEPVDLAPRPAADPHSLWRAADHQRPHLVVHVQLSVRFPESCAVLVGTDQ